MIEIRRSAERGQSKNSWLESYHTFSFSDYYDPNYMGVSCLRVINDDKVIAGAGFSTHSHQDMEIITYVKTGMIEHKDSMGNTLQLPAGEFQLMSAGSGISHSEYNASDSETLEFLQIWIQPNNFGIEPTYQQKRFSNDSELQLIASATGQDESFILQQNAKLYDFHLDTKQSYSYTSNQQATTYIHLVSGELEFNDNRLSAGDGATITNTENILFLATKKSQALIFDLP